MEIKTYEQHYDECLEVYGGTEGVNLYNIAIKNNCVEIDLDLLKEVTDSVKDHLERNHDTCESKWATYINNFSSIKGIEEFCLSKVDQLEKKYFNSYVKIENLHILQNKTHVPLESSWVWHYDDCPKEFLKFAIYLNDVTDDNGPMQIVKNKDSIAPIIESYRNHPGAIKGYPPPVFPKSRVPPSFVDSIVSSGGSIESLTGKAGTNFLFTPNTIHRGTAPKIGCTPRIAIFMFVRPTMKKISNLTSLAKPKKANVNVKKYNLD